MRTLHAPLILSIHIKIFKTPQNISFFSSGSPQKPKWNSNSDLIIKHPVLQLIESCNLMSQLKQIQAHMTRTGLISHVFPASRLVSFCALSDSGDINHAHQIFAQIQAPNTYIWNTMIRGYSKFKLPNSSLLLFRRMVREGVEMDKRSFVFALKACEQIRGDVFEGEGILCRICKLGFDSETLIRNGLIHLYVKKGCLAHARQVFELSPVRDVVSWTTMIDGYAQRNFPSEAFELFKLMLASGIEPNEVTMITLLTVCSMVSDLSLGRWIHKLVEKSKVNVTLNLMNSLVDMYVKCNCLNIAREIFNKMETKDVYSWTSMINGYAKQGNLELARQLFDNMPERNVVSWNAMIAGYLQNTEPKKALELFYKMEAMGDRPVEGTLVSVLSACAQLGCFDLGQKIYNQYIDENRVQSSVIMGNAFIDMCAKCGNVDAAAEFFNKMPERDLVSWNSMIAGYAIHGYAEQALKLFREIITMGIRPDDITFVGVLSACSHGGLVRQGRQYFEEMKRVFEVEPKAEHYACMIDLLGRVGYLEEAFKMILRMPMEPDEAAWGALLNAARLHGNVALGKFASIRLLNLDPEDSGIYVLLANMYATKRRWNDVRTVRSMMRTRRIKKTPGRSSVEVDGKSHEFFVADQSHPQSEDVYKVLNDMLLLLKLEGYVPDTSVHMPT